MKNQAFNPFLPSYEYVPDGEPHIFDERVYLYGSHDIFNGINFCLNDYVCWSAPVDDLSDWRYEGIIFRKTQDPEAILNSPFQGMAAPDVCKGADGKYYLYYFLGGTDKIHVAVCDKPAGTYQFLGHVHYLNGTPIGKNGDPLQFDPGIFIDDDGRIYLYSGFSLYNNPFLGDKARMSAHGAMCFELEQDMITVKQGPIYIGIKSILESKGTEFENHEFLEASSMRKFNGLYYFIYSSYQSHELCYATSNRPMGPFSFGGVLISNGDIGLSGRYKKNAMNYTGNTHGSILQLRDKYYVFYHRQTNRKQFSRQACAEEINFKSGKFHQAEMTSCGLNNKSLKGKGVYEARIACNLMSRHGTRFYSAIKGPKLWHPYFTQTGKDRDTNPNQYIANITNGAVVGFKYFEFYDTKRISVKVKGCAIGYMQVSTEIGGTPIANIKITFGTRYHDCKAKMKRLEGKQPLYFTFKGIGSLDFYSFELK